MYSRDELKALTDKVLNMARGDGAEVDFSGGERAATRFANSNTTANIVQFDQSLTVTVYQGGKAGSSTTREFDDEALKEMVDDAQKKAEAAKPAPDAQPLVSGPQDYIPVDAVLPSGVNFGPAERGRMVKQSLDICQKKNVVGSGYIPKTYLTTCNANTRGLFAYYQSAEAGFILTCRTSDGGGPAGRASRASRTSAASTRRSSPRLPRTRR